jgi:hypothetical protein
MIQYETQCAASVRRTQPQFHCRAVPRLRRAARAARQQPADAPQGGTKAPASGKLSQEAVHPPYRRYHR